MFKSIYLQRSFYRFLFYIIFNHVKQGIFLLIVGYRRIIPESNCQSDFPTLVWNSKKYFMHQRLQTQIMTEPRQNPSLLVLRQKRIYSQYKATCKWTLNDFDFDPSRNSSPPIQTHNTLPSMTLLLSFRHSTETVNPIPWNIDTFVLSLGDFFFLSISELLSNEIFSFVAIISGNPFTHRPS